MSKSREEFLSFRDDLGNTLLHAAIVANDTGSALKYIQDDISASDGKTIVNIKSMENTALLLAIKKGNIAVAEALLKHPAVDVQAKDCRGLTALHWACMLRQDRLIEALMAKGADPHLEAKKWVEDPKISETLAMTPINLYENSVWLDNLRAYANAADHAIYLEKKGRERHEDKERAYYDDVSRTYHRSIYYYVFNIGKEYKPPYAERTDLYIPGSMAYTDVIFHIDDICNNLHWTGPRTHFVKFEEVSSTAEMFRHNFVAGMADFCSTRNAIPVNAELLQKMKDFKPIVLERKAAHPASKISLFSGSRVGISEDSLASTKESKKTTGPGGTSNVG